MRHWKKKKEYREIDMVAPQTKDDDRVPVLRSIKEGHLIDGIDFLGIFRISMRMEL